MPRLLLLLVALLLLPSPALAIDDEHKQKAEAMIAKSIAFLKTRQHESGGWSINPGGPSFPAITALILNGMAMQPDFDPADPAAAKAISYLLSQQQPDGGVYNQILPSYNTSIAVSALARIDTPEAKAATARAVEFLKQLQYGETSLLTGPAAAEVQRVTPEHPFYGGVGYGRAGRPDLSNTGFFIQAMHDADVEENDAAFRRAVVFLERLQMDDRINHMPYAAGSRQGGFIYATAENKDNPGGGQSFAGTIEETLDDGTRVSRLRAYGSMTYSGFKSYIYAKLHAGDPRVQAAFDWITHNYTVQENPGLGTDGFYYYLLTFARALDAWGQDTLAIPGSDGKMQERDWANDLIDRLAELQNEDGSFRVLDDRWLEDNPDLISAYALLALQHAVR